MAQHSRVRAFFTPDASEEILRRIADGESLNRICGPDRAPGLPDRFTVHRHLREDPAFRLSYLIAREAQAATLADQVIEIADGEAGTGKDANVGRDWLRVSARQWLAGVMAPRSYGGRRFARDEMAELEAKQGDGMTTAERAARIVAILEAVRVRAEGEGALLPEGEGTIPGPAACPPEL